MSLDKMTVYVMSTDEMTVDKIFINQITGGMMSIDKMTVDKMAFPLKID
jgi:hypothetical protein